MPKINQQMICYLFDPTSQNTEPIIKAHIVVKNNITTLYYGLLQYTRFCFHKQVLNWEKSVWEYVEEKCKGSEPVCGVLVCWIKASISLLKDVKNIKLLFRVSTHKSQHQLKKLPILLRVFINHWKVLPESFFSSRCSHFNHPICSIVITWHRCNSIYTL